MVVTILVVTFMGLFVAGLVGMFRKQKVRLSSETGRDEIQEAIDRYDRRVHGPLWKGPGK